jgi:hypothetical protein
VFGSFSDHERVPAEPVRGNGDVVRAVRVQRRGVPSELREQRGLCTVELRIVERLGDERVPGWPVRDDRNVVRALRVQRQGVSHELRFR